VAKDCVSKTVANQCIMKTPNFVNKKMENIAGVVMQEYV
jgi:hypothetical protein